jgi:hypothetical protein
MPSTQCGYSIQLKANFNGTLPPRCGSRKQTASIIVFLTAADIKKAKRLLFRSAGGHAAPFAADALRAQFRSAFGASAIFHFFDKLRSRT